MDKFKQYLKDQREELDEEMPGDGVWKNIQVAVEGGKKSSSGKLIKFSLVAAAVITGVLLSIKLLMPGVGSGKAVAVYAGTIDSTFPNQITAVVVPEKTEAPGLIQQDQSAKSPVKPNTYSLVNDFENTYTAIVNLQLKSIRGTAVLAESADYFDGFKTALRQADEEETIIKKIIKTKGLNDDLLQRLINISQHKIDILKSLRAEINKTNERARQNDETSPAAYYLNI